MTISRRNALKLLSAGGALGVAPLPLRHTGAQVPTATTSAAATGVPPGHARRIKWWQDAKFGMFIHWGTYSVRGRHEWVLENEAIAAADYEQLAREFKPVPTAARAWAQLARRAGMKYMVMTTKHHEGFCLFDTKTTGYCAPKQGPGRDLVREYVDAARAEGLRVGFYYSLMDWHHPDGARAEKDQAARKRLVDYIHTHIRELMSNYGKIEILWYDVAWPLDAAGWESERMNEMVFSLQPDIIVNNRNRLPGDFSTPEQRIEAAEEGKAWEACMTMNGSWGYNAGDDDWKTPKQIVKNLISCSRDGGNYLLNIGPKGDGSIPEESVRILEAVGAWMQRNGETIYATDRCQPRRSNYAMFTRKGNTLYMHVHAWPGDTMYVAGFLTPVKSARLLASGEPVKLEQDRMRVRLSGLPSKAPDQPATTIALECDGEPRQDQYVVRRDRPRLQV